MDVEFQESPESSKSGSSMDIAHSVRSVSFMDVANFVRCDLGGVRDWEARTVVAKIRIGMEAVVIILL